MPRVSRAGIVHGALGVFAAALVIKAAQVQLWQGAAWAARAEHQHFTAAPLPAPRGDILDASGAPIVRSRELVRLSVAPRELRDRTKLRRALLQAGVPATWAARASDPRRAWVTLPGRWVPADVAAAVAMRGVYAEPVGDRVLLASAGVRRLVGHLDANGDALDGLELALDSLLRGQQGSATLVRDARGRTFASPTAPGTAPRRGRTVVLTINTGLQAIAERALADAAAKMGASGGDIIVLDPHTGGVLARASRRADERAGSSTALTEPFEPGSTLKPFIAAALLERGRASISDVVNTHDGRWTVDGRTITDVHRAPRMTLEEVIMHSSNIGIAQFATRLSPAEEYETLRDAGFGMVTGVPYPVEAAGTLRPPRQWSRTSAMSLAMGYEITVTPLQLAAAYAAFANGGELLEPHLVSEVRSTDGDVEYRMERRVVRRVMSPATARTMRQLLQAVVSQGSAVEADLATFAVGGKTGTARRVAGGRYATGRYTATFVGMFPADEPQYVVLVKLDDPQGAYYGGATAAPVSRAVLEAAIAARDAALDRGALAVRERRPNLAPARREEAVVARATRAADTAEPSGATPYMVHRAQSSAPPAPARAPRAVPDVGGLPLREAVHTLHRAGFRVQLARGPGSVAPASGTVLPAGAVVRLYRE